MVTLNTFEEEVKYLKENYEHDQFEYDASSSFRSIVDAHFSKVTRHDMHGVYIIRKKETGEVLYIGQSGSVQSDGSFKDQDIPKRLKNVKGSIPSNTWFRKIVEEKGVLIIEYVFLEKSPISPVLAESVLLQAYLNEHNKLPYKNKKL